MKNEKKVIHVILDEKFIDMALREFESVAPGVNIPIIMGQPRPLRYVKSNTVKFHSVKSARKLIKSPECAAVIFHSLGDLTLLTDIPKDKKVVWLGWGYDYYDRLLSDAYPDGLFLAKSRALLDSLPKTSLTHVFVGKIRNAFNMALGRSLRYRPELLSRVDIFSPVIDVEHRMACELNSWFRPEYVPWNYGTVEDDLSVGEDVGKPLGINILVGNNAYCENNHLEIFEILKSCVDLTGRKIIVPLSYGNDWYKEKIIDVGRAMFGDQFVPLSDFMEKAAYIELLHSCGHVFMNHLRQQALGNICIMMLKGAQIYMNPISPLYHWLLGRGAVIQSIDSLDGAVGLKSYDLVPLSMADQTNNAKVVQAHWRRDVQRAKTQKLINIATGYV